MHGDHLCDAPLDPGSLSVAGRQLGSLHGYGRGDPGGHGLGYLATGVGRTALVWQPTPELAAGVSGATVSDVATVVEGLTFVDEETWCQELGVADDPPVRPTTTTMVGE